MKQSVHYHNSTQQPKQVVKVEIEKAISQEKRILAIFKTHKKLSASKVFNLFHLVKYRNEIVLLTSIRRAISNLVFEKKIEILPETTTGMYGKPEHFYKIV